MRVLLAGATGAIGVPLVRALTGAGHRVVALVRDPGKHDLVRGLGAEPVTADVMQRDALLRAVEGMRADAVLHEATALRGAAPRLKVDDPTTAHGTPPPRAMPRGLLRLGAPYLACLMADTSMRVSNAKAREELGWQPSYGSLSEGLAAPPPG